MAVPPDTDNRILIAGAGPVGMVAALALARRSVPITVFEAAPEIQTDPRAGCARCPRS